VSAHEALLGMRTDYDSDHGLKTYDSDLDTEPKLAQGDIPQHERGSVRDIELETVLSIHL
jgi:hypothetical protein